MTCPIDVALSALRLGHVTWAQLHPEVRVRLATAGYRPDMRWGANRQRARCDRVRQPGDHIRASEWRGRW